MLNEVLPPSDFSFAQNASNQPKGDLQHTKPGILYLIPSPLGDESDFARIFPPFISQIINSIDDYIVEEERSARRYLRKLNITKPIEQLNFYLLNEHTVIENIELFVHPLLQGRNMGIISEAGVPCVADPGAAIVHIAHKNNIRVVPLTGPSSILLALMASGLSGQNFTFHGYLPVEKSFRIKALKDMERLAVTKKQSQIFIETPYRNRNVLQDIIEHCSLKTQLCIACDITLPEEFIKTRTIEAWKNQLPDIHKRPAIFILQG